MSSTLSGPTSGTIYKSSVFTVAQSTAFNGIVTPSDGGQGGIFAPLQLLWSGTKQNQTFTYIPNKISTISISISASSGTVSGSPISLVVAANTTKSVVFTGPALGGNTFISATQGIATGNFTVTPNGTLTDTIVPWDSGAGGTFSPTSLVFTSATPQTFTYTPAKTQLITISLISLVGNVYPGQFLVDSGPPAATTATLTGPATARAGFFTSTPYTISLDGYYSGTITPNDSSQGGTFIPAKIVYSSNSNAPQIFLYQPSSTASGNKTIAITASPSLTISGAITTNVSAVQPIQPFGPGVYNPFYHGNPTNS